MNDDKIIHEQRMRRLEELTVKLSGIPNGVKGCVQYNVEHGIAFGFSCLDDPKVSVQKAVMSKGAKFPTHTHYEHEWLIVYDGEIAVYVDGECVKIGRAGSVLLKPGIPHSVDALEDTWMIGVTIPPTTGYPK